MTHDHPTKLRAVRWRVTAPGSAMKEAEDALFGSYDNHMSSCDWSPMYEDDERPDDPDYSIEADTRTEWGRARMADLFKVAGFLGDRCMVGVSVDTPALSLRIDSANTGLQYARIDRRVVAGDMEERMKQAARLLTENPTR